MERKTYVLRAAAKASDGPPVESLTFNEIPKDGDFLFINHEPFRTEWNKEVTNKRPFIIYDRCWTKISSSATLSGAIKKAKTKA